MVGEQKEQWYRAFGNLPDKKKKQSPTNALTDAVREYAEVHGCVTARINVTGIYDESTGKWRTSNATRGVEDIDVTYPTKIYGIPVGIKIAVEVKYGRDTQSEHQKKRQDKLEKAGAHYIIAKDIDTFKKDFDELVKHYGKITERPGTVQSDD
jgi:hypothetical protein